MPHKAEDWAPYQELPDAVRAYIRDATTALDALAIAVDMRAVHAFTLERVATPQAWGESLWQEVALTDGKRLILWHGDDELDEDVSGGPGIGDGAAGDRASTERIFTSSIRTIPLSAVVDQGMRTRYRVDADGNQTLDSVMLYLSTQTPERAVTELSDANETRTVNYVETYRFSKSVLDGGLAQMQRLLGFGRVLSRSMKG